ncbi:MAG: radical SAM protein [Ignavibacteria bacterium]|nr:radical SAM protein [Ignavibacteria bacterium]
MDRDYIYIGATTTMCPSCVTTIPGKFIQRNSSVYLLRNCPVHGESEELFEEDAVYHRWKQEFEKPGTISATQTTHLKGCPFDCGLCPQHDQHSCISVIEITNACNLSCPICYACSGEGNFLSIEKFSSMLEFALAAEGGCLEILQISGGEPTLHPELIEFISLARTKNIKYIMLNTNGVRIAEDLEFVKQLAKFKSTFEIYLQFDGFKSKASSRFRNSDLLSTKMKAIENLRKFNIPMTLVTTVESGINEDELGDILTYAMKTSCIRGVNIQPIAFFGKGLGFSHANRLTLSGIIRRIEEQLPDIFIKGDIVPLPCNTERVAVTYLARGNKDKYIPITREFKVTSFLPLIDNTFAFDADRILKKAGLPGIGCSCFDYIKGLRRIIPLSYALKTEGEKLEYLNENTFRVSITSFVDLYNFDLKSAQKECVHIITPDLKRIPFSMFNMLYRK